MPPKSNDIEKKELETESGEPDETEKDLVEHELVLNYMKSRLGKCQESEGRLFVENVTLKKELQEKETNFKDINEYLQLQLDEKTTRIQELETQKAEVEKSLKTLSNDSKFALSKLRTENENLRNELQKKTNEFNKKIRGTQDFLSQKEELEAELAQFKITMEEAAKQQEQKLADLERRHIQDRENWKREMAKKVKEAKAQMMELTDNQLEMTTKRTIMENEQMASELAYQSRQTETMLHHNEVLRDGNTDLKLQVELSKQTQDEFAKRNLVYQRTIHKLLNKIDEQKRKNQEDEHKATSLTMEIAQERENHELTRMKLEEAQEALEKLNCRCRSHEEKISLLMCEKDESTRFLLQCLRDVKRKTVTVACEGSNKPDKNAPLVVQGQLEHLLPSQRERALIHLLSKLGLDTEQLHSL